MIRIRNKRRFVIFILIMSLLVALLSVAIFTIWLSRQQAFDPGNTETMLVTIPRGTSTSGIGEILESKGLISNSTVFRLKRNLPVMTENTGPANTI